MACARAQVQEKNECVASRMTFIGDVLAAPSCGYRTIRSAFHVRHASTSNMTCSVLLAAHPASASKVLQACSVLLAASNASHKPSPLKALTPAGHLAFPLAMSGLGKAHKDGKLIVNHQADCVPNGDLHCQPFLLQAAQDCNSRLKICRPAACRPVDLYSSSLQANGISCRLMI